jgi:hypothetical protein
LLSAAFALVCSSLALPGYKERVEEALAPSMGLNCAGNKK